MPYPVDPSLFAPGELDAAYLDGPHPSLETALRLFVIRVGECVGDSDVRAEILYKRPDQNCLEPLAAVGFDPGIVRDVQLMIQRDEPLSQRGLVREALRTGERVLASDCATDARWLPATVPAAADDTRCELIVLISDNVALNLEAVRPDVFNEHHAAEIDAAAKELRLIVHHEVRHAGEDFLAARLSELRECEDITHSFELCLDAVMELMDADYGGFFSPPGGPTDAKIRSLRLTVNRGLNRLNVPEAYPLDRFGTIREALHSSTGDAYRSRASRDIDKAKDLVDGVTMSSNYCGVLQAADWVFGLVHVESSKHPALSESHRRACRAFLQSAAAHIAALYWAEGEKAHRGITHTLLDVWHEEHGTIHELTTKIQKLHSDADGDASGRDAFDELYAICTDLANDKGTLMTKLGELCRTLVPHSPELLRHEWDRALEAVVPERDRRMVELSGDWDFEVFAQRQAVRETCDSLAWRTHADHRDAHAVTVVVGAERVDGMARITMESRTDGNSAELRELFEKDRTPERKAQLQALLDVSNWRLETYEVDPGQGLFRICALARITGVES